MRATHPHARRLTDVLLDAYNQACDEGDEEVARELLQVLERLAARPSPTVKRRRGVLEDLLAAHERFWRMRHVKGAE